MNSVPTSCTAFAIQSTFPLQFIHSGVRAPQELFPQPRRKLPEFIAFLVVKGEIHLTDELPDGSESVIVRAGEIHVVAPDQWQTSTKPFDPGIVFLWFHFTAGPVDFLTGEQVDSVVREQWHPPAHVLSQPRWLIPRHLSLATELNDFTRVLQELQDNARLWGEADRGSQAIAAAFVYRLHRAFVRSREQEPAFIRAAPEAVHVGRARAFICLHHETSIALAEVAAAINLNPAYLSRCFRRVTGQTVGAALLAARMETAKRLLREGHSVKATAHQAGFGSASYFCRQFMRVTGTTPRAALNPD